MSKNLKTLSIVVIVLFIGIISTVFYASQVSAISVKELLGLDKKATVTDNKNKSANKKATKDWAKSSQNSPPNPQIDLDYVSLLIANMNKQESAKILGDSKLFKQVIENEANNRSAVSAAIANKVEQDKNINFLMRRSAETILREAYLNRFVISKLPKDFPTAEQVAEYFKSNKDQFVVPERIPVWQIFLKKPEKANAQQIKALKKKAEKIISNMEKKKANYSDVAIAQSEHEQSRIQGGYMGLLNVKDLLPEMKVPLLKLKEGQLSKPVESNTGIHILKRGKILKAQTFKLSQVEAQIRQILINQANARLRQEIFAQARKEYPQNISDKTLEEWRLRLKTNTN